MIRFHTLGTVSLEGTRGRSIDPVLARPALVGLLAHLACTPVPGGFVRRDSLLATFWPDSDQEHARHALRQALYRLRAGLGEKVVRGRGDEEIALDPDGIWSDVQAFERERRAGKLDAALELYRGDFLPGFFLSRSPPFESWLELERATLRERAAEVAWAMTGELERSGRLQEAAHLSRRAVRILPYDEPGVRRAVSLLDRIGDRAGALHLYEEFARTVRREFDAEPAPDTVALIEDVRRSGHPGGGPTARKPETWRRTGP